jgi:TetR/AcrR family transcriptional repressor of mexJK operon
MGLACAIVKTQPYGMVRKMTATAPDTGVAFTAIAPAESAKTEARRRAILDVAAAAFLEDGFAATSMSSIASRLGGSKGTLYNYYRSKEELFAAFMTDVCGGRANALFDHLPKIEDDLRGTLVELGVNFLNFVMSEPVLSIHRLVVAEAGRFPEVGRLFYETGPKLGEVRLGAYLEQAMRDGHLRDADPIRAAKRFKDLIMSDIYTRKQWGVADDIGEAESHAVVSDGVDMFLAY